MRILIFMYYQAVRTRHYYLQPPKKERSSVNPSHLLGMDSQKTFLFPLETAPLKKSKGRQAITKKANQQQTAVGEEISNDENSNILECSE